MRIKNNEAKKPEEIRAEKGWNKPPRKFSHKEMGRLTHFIMEETHIELTRMRETQKLQKKQEQAEFDAQYAHLNDDEVVSGGTQWFKHQSSAQ